jgi:hypothetical protein
MRQCPDCEEKDRVVIAGKVFCANCGTPWQPADTSEEAVYKKKIGMDQTGEQPAVVSTPAPASPAVAPAPSPAPQPAAPALTPAPSAPQPASASTPAPSAAPVAPPSPQPVVVPQQPAPVQQKALADLQSQVGSEIPNLDSKDESILSDSQIKEMAATAVPAPAVTTPPQPAPAPSPVPQPAAPTPQPPVAPQPTPAPNPTPSPTSQPVAGRVLTDIVAPQTVATQPVQPAAPVPATTADADTTTVAGVTMSRDDALKLALGEDAASEPAPKSGPARPTAVVMTVIGLVLLGAFLWQANATDIQVKLASLRAGLTASVPGFVPGGWSKAQSLQASEGGVSYELVKDGKALKIEQQKTDWDSQAVLEQYVLKRSTDYLALQSQGLTIYMFGDNQAAWVNQGTLYTLSGDHGIEQDDIIRMATSL